MIMKLEERSKNSYSAKEMRPSLLVSKSMKKVEGAQHSSPDILLSPLKKPSLTRLDSDGGNTGTMALIRSDGLIYISPSGVWIDAKYSNTFSGGLWILIRFS